MGYFDKDAFDSGPGHASLVDRACRGECYDDTHSLRLLPPLSPWLWLWLWLWLLLLLLLLLLSSS